LESTAKIAHVKGIYSAGSVGIVSQEHLVYAGFVSDCDLLQLGAHLLYQSTKVPIAVEQVKKGIYLYYLCLQADK